MKCCNLKFFIYKYFKKFKMKRTVTNSLKNSFESLEAIESKFVDMNLEFSKINKKVFQFE